ncbi:MAG: hypothetical protein ACOYEC_04510 [Christensenellales bacterium]|jgi:hypothetical protein|nr:hypothetical protein [Clostridiales bacterium]
MSTRTQAFVNFYAAMGSLQTYTALDSKARELAAKQDIAVRFKVKDGPDGVLVFNKGAVKAVPYTEGMPTDIVLYCSSCDKFNDLVNGTGQSVIPMKGFFKLGFLLKKDSAFNVLTKQMADLMRQKEFDNEEDKKISTLLAFNAMVAGIVQIGNVDELGRMSAKRIPDGDIGIEIKDECYCTVRAQNGILEYIPAKTEKARSKMVFDSLATAKGVIDGALDAMSCISTGSIAMSGFIPMLLNLNNILNLVPKYLS